MFQTPKISIIVAVYNGQYFLDRCITNILNQTFKDFEVILINDGSNDRSLEICHAFAMQDSRIRVINNLINKGVSASRQIGINWSSGEYSIHIDIDDKVDSHMLEDLYNTAKERELDILIADYYLNSDHYISQKKTFTSNKKIIESILTGKTMGAMWNKLIKTSLYKEYAITFPDGINYCEDVFVLVSLLVNENIIVGFLDKAYYHYIFNKNSITNSITKKSINERILFINKLTTVLLNKNISIDLLMWHKIDIKYSMFSSGLFSYVEFKNVFSEINRKCLLYKHSARKARLLIYLASINKCLWLITKRIYILQNRYV